MKTYFQFEINITNFKTANKNIGKYISVKICVI